MKTDCFTYGSLMDERILRHVCGRSFAQVPARLSGYARHPIAGAPYPGICPEPGSTVAGILYYNIDACALERLDHFEGPQYERCAVTVTDSLGHQRPAQTYVLKPTLHHLLQPGEWDFKRFLEDAEELFHHHYFGQ